MGVIVNSDLWRICRAVSTESRLRLLKLLFDNRKFCVKQLALHAGLTESHASIQLKQLFSAGLIRYRRENMNVFYRAEADERIVCAVELLDALKSCMRVSAEFESVIRAVTAFTHERRVEIVQALCNGPLESFQLLERCGMTSSALFRHLGKLETRGVVRKDGTRYCLVIPNNRFASALMRIVVGKEEE